MSSPRDHTSPFRAIYLPWSCLGTEAHTMVCLMHHLTSGTLNFHVYGRTRPLRAQCATTGPHKTTRWVVNGWLFECGVGIREVMGEWMGRLPRVVLSNMQEFCHSRKCARLCATLFERVAEYSLVAFSLTRKARLSGIAQLSSSRLLSMFGAL